MHIRDISRKLFFALKNTTFLISFWSGCQVPSSRGFVAVLNIYSCNWYAFSLSSSILKLFSPLFFKFELFYPKKKRLGWIILVNRSLFSFFAYLNLTWELQMLIFISKSVLEKFSFAVRNILTRTINNTSNCHLPSEGV